MSIKISIIIPVYNASEYLNECLDSVLSQTITDIEVVCVNDGSTDNSLDILNNISKKDDRIIVVNKENEGAGKTRNVGLKTAKGEFIAFMDADDYYPKNNTLEYLYNKAIEHSADICGGKCLKLENGQIQENVFDKHDLDFNVSGCFNYKDYQFDYGYTAYIYSTAMLLVNNIIFPYYRRFQDPPFMVKAMTAAKKIYTDDTPSYIYRLTPSSEKIKPNKVIDMLHGIQENLEFSREHDLSKLHYLTYMRLNKEGSYVVSSNLLCEQAGELLAQLSITLSRVNAEWLINEGYEISNPPQLDVFNYLLEVNKKYENIRNNPLVKIARKVRG